MANINLLPWRTERRKLREREFYMMLLGTAVAAVVALFLAISWMGHLIDTQNDRNAYMQEQIKGLDAQIEEIKELDKTRSQLLTRKDIIEQLQSNRSQMVHLFDDMVKTIPDGVRLTSMKQAGDTLKLLGIAESNSRVASYMRNIDSAQWMGRSDLVKIENSAGATGSDKKMPYVFALDVKLHKPPVKDQEGEQDGEPGDMAPANAASAAPADAQKPADAAAPATVAPAAQHPASTGTAPPQAPPPTTPATGEKK